MPSRLVIQRSEVDYLAPVRTDCEAVCRKPDVETWAGFSAGLERRRKARLKLAAEIVAAGRVVARHKGVYVAFLAT